MSIYYIPPINIMGRGCIAEAKEPIKALGAKKAFIVSDKFLTSNGTVKKITNMLDEIGVAHVLYNDVKPNPTVNNVNNGLEILKKEDCDIVITIGGGSPQDCGKAISILATNGGTTKDYEGVNKTTKNVFLLLL